MLSDALIERILERLPYCTVGVLGDLFLDRYLDIDPALNELSLETGLTAYQVVRVRSYPGAAGTVINNLAALGVGRIVPISFIGDDGEGYELRQALGNLANVDCSGIVVTSQRRTPTYTKPLLAGQELNRLDIKNRSVTSVALQEQLVGRLQHYWPTLDALVVLDQVSEPDCGVVTDLLRSVVAELAGATPQKFVLADSRERIGLFRNVSLKPNERECRQACQVAADVPLESCILKLAHQCGRAVFCTRSEQGVILAEPADAQIQLHAIPAFAVTGPIDPVGAGDSCSAGIVCAMLAGATYAQAAAFGNLVASITIQQLGVTGTASPSQVRQRWQTVRSALPTALE